MNSVSRFRVIVIAVVTAFTLGIHYGWLVEPIFGHVHWLHAVHGRFCYIPIMIAAAWFGLRGGLITATAISLLVLPLLVRSASNSGDLATEVAEVVFYYTIAVLIGVLVDREYVARRLRNQAQGQVERSQKLSLVGQIAAGVAHEIKNPLASIKGAADILTDEDTSPQARDEFKDILHREVRRIDSTVGEFLEFARPREAQLARMNLSEVVRQTVRQIEAQAQQAGVSVAADIQDDVFIHADSEKIHQMTLNLLLNAVQACVSGSDVHVDVAADTEVARMTVRDRGKGIDAESLEHIFEPFYTTRPSGTGLGLAVVRAIVDAHSGDIAVSSSPAAGTTVTVTLPISRGGE